MQLASMSLSEGPGLTRRVLLEGQDPVPDGLGMAGGRTKKPGQRCGGDGRAPVPVRTTESGDHSLTS